MRTIRGISYFLTAVACCGLLCFLSSISLASRATAQGLACKEHVAVDYEGVFRTMPKLNEPSASGRVHFGPSALRVTQASESAVQAPNGAFGYFVYLGVDERRFTLRWLVTAQIVQIDSQGQDRRVVATLRRRVNVLKSTMLLDFSVPLRSRPGLYRYDLDIRKQSGKFVGAVSHYVRAVKPKFSVRLDLANSTLHQGDKSMSRVLNLGTTELYYGEGIEVQQLRESEWVRAPEFSPTHVHRRAARLLAGQAGPCEAFQVPETVPTGQYRLVKRVTSFYKDRSRIIRTPFEVVE